MMGGSKRLGDVLMDQGYLTEDHVKWILSRQGGKIPLAKDTTLFGDLCVTNEFVKIPAVARALKIQRKESKKGDARRIGEILVAEDEMSPADRDAILLLQERLRGNQGAKAKKRGTRSVLVLEAGQPSRRNWRPIAAAAFAGILILVLVLLIAFAVLR
jgi:hypothetical protein